MAAVAGTILAAVAGANPFGVDHRDLAEVRRATAKYDKLDRALADGCQLGYRRIITSIGRVDHDARVGVDALTVGYPFGGGCRRTSAHCGVGREPRRADAGGRSIR